jgi:hypothetical protein
MMTKLKIFKKSFNSYSRRHEIHQSYREEAELLHGTGYMELVDYEDYKKLQAQLDEANKELRFVYSQIRKHDHSGVLKALFKRKIQGGE